jgi:hypothetical protein
MPPRQSIPGIPGRCVDADHQERLWVRAVERERSRLYGGLYDESGSNASGSASASVRLLNPGFAGADATSRRFALIEID